METLKLLYEKILSDLPFGKSPRYDYGATVHAGEGIDYDKIQDLEREGLVNCYFFNLGGMWCCNYKITEAGYEALGV